jgi:hypothetical protein
VLAQISNHIAHELGIGPATYLESLPNLASVRNGYSFKATVDNPEKLAAHGLKDVKKGDDLNVVYLDKNWKLRPTSNRKAVTIQVDLDRFIRPISQTID